NLTIDGSYAMDDAALEAGKSFAGQDQQAVMAALAEDPQALIDLVNGTDFDLTVSYTMNQELADFASANAGVEIPASGSMGAIMVDGVLYADLSEFAALGAPEGWIGVPVAEALQAQVDVWRRVRGLTPKALAQQIADDRIDILLDLSGHTGGNRLMTFARKPAPVQATRTRRPVAPRRRPGASASPSPPAIPQALPAPATMRSPPPATAGASAAAVVVPVAATRSRSPPAKPGVTPGVTTTTATTSAMPEAPATGLRTPRGR
ncbi:MAG TPA: hypothetical protein PLQ18_04850, partial [Plasticicumulans sp.]|nr:hypothetical protein [Plasticicumulans sp.]